MAMMPGCTANLQSRAESTHPRTMTMSVTLILLALFAAAFAFASWRASRPTIFGKVRLIPWTPLIIVFAMAALMMLVHAVNLLGIETGTNSMRPR
jgi:amino acid transporter